MMTFSINRTKIMFYYPTFTFSIILLVEDFYDNGYSGYPQMTQNLGSVRLQKSLRFHKGTSVLYDWEDFSFEFDLDRLCSRSILKNNP